MLHIARKPYWLLVIALVTCFSCSRKGGDDPAPVPPPNTGFAKGADVSWLTEMEAAGKKFYNAAGVEKECMSILKDLGMNTIRLRVWVNPSGSYNTIADVTTKALRAKAPSNSFN